MTALTYLKPHGLEKYTFGRGCRVFWLAAESALKLGEWSRCLQPVTFLNEQAYHFRALPSTRRVVVWSTPGLATMFGPLCFCWSVAPEVMVHKEVSSTTRCYCTTAAPAPLGGYRVVVPAGVLAEQKQRWSGIALRPAPFFFCCSVCTTGSRPCWPYWPLATYYHHSITYRFVPTPHIDRVGLIAPWLRAPSMTLCTVSWLFYGTRRSCYFYGG